MGNWFQILIIVLAVGGPVLGRVLQAIDKKQKARQKQKDLEARQLEALRTGRVSTETLPTAPRPGGQARPGRTVPTASTGSATARNATQRMQELAQKRQQQLEELRRRQRAAQQQAAGQTARSGPAPTASRPANLPQAGQTGRPTAKPPRRAKPDPRMAQSRPLSQNAPPVSSLGPSSIQELMVDERVLHPSTEAPPSSASPVKLLGKRMSAEDWRRFIVTRELLDPPLALRRGFGGSFL